MVSKARSRLVFSRLRDSSSKLASLSVAFCMPARFSCFCGSLRRIYPRAGLSLLRFPCRDHDTRSFQAIARAVNEKRRCCRLIAQRVRLALEGLWDGLWIMEDCSDLWCGMEMSPCSMPTAELIGCMMQRGIAR